VSGGENAPTQEHHRYVHLRPITKFGELSQSSSELLSEAK
jgi:hypothetical protein